MSDNEKSGPRPAKPSRPGRPQIWTDDRVRAELVALAIELERLPATPDLERLGRVDLLGGINRSGGFRRWMPIVQAETGLRRPVKPPRSAEPVREQVADVVSRYGTLPRPHRLRDDGYLELASLLSRWPGGPDGLLEQLGYGPEQRRRYSEPLPTRERWSQRRIERELLEVRAVCDRWPTARWFRLNGHGELLTAVRRVEGERYWADRCGFIRAGER